MIDLLVALIKRFEGYSLRAYLCPAGVPTIGFGSTGPDVKLGVLWTAEQCYDRMLSDAQAHLAAAKLACPGATPEQLVAVADFSYNLGSTRMRSSTFVRKLNKGDIPGARRELLKWVHGGGKVLPGLVLRRHAEANLL